MDAKTWLEEMLIIDKEILCAEAELKDIQDVAHRFAYYVNKSQKSKQALKELLSDIKGEIDGFHQYKADVSNAIHSVEDLFPSKVLWYRYFLGYTFSDIADKLNYSIRSVWRFHQQGIICIQSFLEEGEKNES